MTEHIMQFFEYAHLPESLQKVAQPFTSLAHIIVGSLPQNPERTVALRKLLEAKDAAVRARIAAPTVGTETATERAAREQRRWEDNP